jgi:hypothetical protein
MSPDPALPFPGKWTHKMASCQHSFGLPVVGLLPNRDYTVCVLSAKKAATLTAGQQDGPVEKRVDVRRQCDRIWLSHGQRNQMH